MRRSRSLAVFAGAALALGPALPAMAAHDVQPARIGGDDRFDTAAEVALADHPDGSSEVIVASGLQFPDALAGAPAAAAFDAPILLTGRDHLPEPTLAALRELGPDHVTVLGGPAAVSEQVEATIAQSARVETDRIAGEHRYETAAAIARTAQASNDNAGNWPGGQRAAFLTTGENFPDALAAGAPAAHADQAPIPILLTAPDAVPAATQAAIDDLEIDLVVIVGGPSAVSPAVQAVIEDGDTTTDRWAGVNRTETATVVADNAIEYLGFGPQDLTLARGDLFPDALTVAPLTGGNGNPILLTADPTTLSTETHDWLAQRCEAVERIRGVGQEQALSIQVLEDAEHAAEDCHGTDPVSEQDILVAPQEHISATAGEPQDFEAMTRHDDAADELTEPLDVALFPCEDVREPTSGDFRFVDEDPADGNADGIESTNTGAAVITAINGDAVADTHGQRGVAPNAEGRIAVTVESDAADCAAVVFYDDENDDRALNIDANGYPTEAWGFSSIEWS